MVGQNNCPTKIKQANRGSIMACYHREKTKYPGVFIVERNGKKSLYILYRREGTRKLIERNWAARLVAGHRHEQIRSVPDESRESPPATSKNDGSKL